MSPPLGAELGIPFFAASLALVVQATAGSVAGIVRDEATGLPLAGAVVLLVDLDRGAMADAEGRYLLRDVPAGHQHVVVRRIGYEPRALDLLVPSEGALELNIALRRDPVTLEPIEVHAAVPVRGFDDPDSTTLPDRSLSLRAIKNSPMLAEPDVLQGIGGAEVLVSPESPSGIHIRGGASDQVVYLLDGIPVFSPYHSAGTFSAWNPDALARLDLFTASASPAFPDGLSGAVSARTRTPGTQQQAQGSVSTTQARATIDGPLGGGASYLLSLRSAFPGLLLHEDEASHVQGKGFDWLGKVAAPILGGHLELLGYGNTNNLGAAGADLQDGSSFVPVRNGFEWNSLSVGGGWTRQLGKTLWQIRGWGAAAHASARWTELESPPQRLVADRQDVGLVTSLEFPTWRGRTTAGIRLERSQTDYALTPVTDAGDSLILAASTPVATAFLEHARPLSTRGELRMSLSAAAATGSMYLSPGAQLRWAPARRMLLSVGYARRHQFAQSLRNPESVVSNIFPADLFVGSGGGEIPVAVSDLGSAGLEFRPSAGLRLGLQAYARGFQGLALVAPRDAGPFSSDGFVEGSGNAYGASLEASAHGAHYGLAVSYGLQHVHLEYGDTSYVPDHGATHAIDAGVIAFPWSSFAIKLSLSSLLGRRATAVEGPFEWEGCNLLDRGCEFSGSPARRSEPLGATRLPAYHRVDLGIRKHWHVRMAGPQGQIAVFGTITNLLGYRNVLTDAVDPATGARTPIMMRPLSPLVVGVDWRF